ncbi:hypothetical protein M2132_001529 [Dysgonomonas sp. PH5-45]|nr:hypothetical protein [Dysgonomonas sp. PH5-45]MDH6388082.1 hypothetical protein [Dysgonomonas sp. PH5-37]
MIFKYYFMLLKTLVQYQRKALLNENGFLFLLYYPYKTKYVIRKNYVWCVYVLINRYLSGVKFLIYGLKTYLFIGYLGLNIRIFLLSRKKSSFMSLQ